MYYKTKFEPLSVFEAFGLSERLSSEVRVSDMSATVKTAGATDCVLVFSLLPFFHPTYDRHAWSCFHTRAKEKKKKGRPDFRPKFFHERSTIATVNALHSPPYNLCGFCELGGEMDSSHIEERCGRELGGLRTGYGPQT